jgi:CobQ-like glutamine amidotransferase family enzyme
MISNYLHVYGDNGDILILQSACSTIANRGRVDKG